MVKNTTMIRSPYFCKSKSHLEEFALTNPCIKHTITNKTLTSKNAKWYKKVLCESRLMDAKGKSHHSSKNNQTDNFDGVPRTNDSSKIDPKKDHQSQSNDGDCAQPIDCLNTSQKICPRIMDVQAEA